jgi:WD40 repeat protein
LFSIAYSPDGKYLASGSGDKCINLWSVENHENYEKFLTFKGHVNQVRSVTFSASGKYIASGSADETIKVWSLE